MSLTSKTESRRRRKQAKQGRKRKRELERRGTTPKFPIHPEKAEKGSEPQKKSA